MATLIPTSDATVADEIANTWTIFNEQEVRCDMYTAIVLSYYLVDLYENKPFRSTTIYAGIVPLALTGPESLHLVLTPVFVILCNTTNDIIWEIEPNLFLRTARDRLEAKATLRKIFEKYTLDIALIDEAFPAAMLPGLE